MFLSSNVLLAPRAASIFARRVRFCRSRRVFFTCHAASAFTRHAAARYAAFVFSRRAAFVLNFTSRRVRFCASRHATIVFHLTPGQPKTALEGGSMGWRRHGRQSQRLHGQFLKCFAAQTPLLDIDCCCPSVPVLVGLPKPDSCKLVPGSCARVDPAGSLAVCWI